ncbi:MAG: beta-N-acetylhexosaminidase, partial [Ferruginibacter sp.]|nr:beta-N-acetylhexosaminidase [Ferruginibacter sp.]
MFCCAFSFAQNQVNVVPYPNNVKLDKGSFELSAITNINYGKGTEKLVKYFIAQVKNLTGLSLKSQLQNGQQLPGNKNSIQFFLKEDAPLTDGYSLSISKSKIDLNAKESSVFFNGIQTLLQLIPLKKTGTFFNIPQVTIKDAARFSYRGMHLDVSRHFFSVSYIKKYLDYLAYYKFNTFHWHLTDDQGWRIEIKKYPLLTKVGGYRNGTIIGRFPGKGNDSIYYGGYYSQQQIKEIVQYAAERYITVIPEIEMPGHASAAIAAYPQLSCFPSEDRQIDSTTAWAGSRVGKHVQQTWGVFNDVFAPTDYTFKFIENVLDEVMALFPSTYIHIGGDECPKENWKRSAFCQQLIIANNLKDEHGLQSYFIQRIEKYVNSKGKKIIGWHEILEGGLAPNATVMSWRGTEGGIAAAKQNHDVVMTPGSHCYFDHSQSSNEDSVTIGSFLPVEKVYNYEPVPAVLTEQQAQNILGAQANVWTEYITNEKKLEYMIFPRMAALAEVLWSKKENKDWKDFERRLPSIFNTYKNWNTSFSNAYYEPVIKLLPSENYDGLQINVSSKMGRPTYHFRNKAEFKLIVHSDSFSENITKSGEYEILLLGDMKSEKKGEKWGAASSSSFNYLFKTDFNISINKATGKNITLTHAASAAYPGNGAFTLVDGIQNTKGLARSAEIVGFLGKDLEAIIDLGI